MLGLGIIVLAAAEVWALIAVGSEIGILPTVGLLLLGSILGGWLLRREGMRAWRAFATAVAGGRPPATEVLSNTLGLIGGVLIVLPGFVSDALGLLCLLPPTRRVLAVGVRRYALRRAARARVVRVRGRRGSSVQSGAGRPGQPPPGRPAADGEVIEGEIGDTDPVNPAAGDK